MMPSFTRAESSANLDYYTSHDPAWCAEIRIEAWEKIDGALVPRRTPWYRITVKHLVGDEWTEHTFTYRPTRAPERYAHLPDRTVTRLVRAELARTDQ